MPPFHPRKQPLTLKSVADLRTMQAVQNGSLPPDGVAYKLHMRLCCLEMERHRREKERQVSLERAAKCESRCRMIESEVQSLMNLLNGRESSGLTKPVVTSAGAAGPSAARPELPSAASITHRY